nr:MAG TPA: hypothetical protein [Caudoviricetes sp.]
MFEKLYFRASQHIFKILNYKERSYYGFYFN